MTLAEEVASLKAQLRDVQIRLANTATRGVLDATDDTAGVQRQKIQGFYGEELTDVQLWQPFGLSAYAPRGADVLILSLGGNRDGAQAVAATNPSFRQTGLSEGETIIYDAGGQTIKLGSDGIVITDAGGQTVTMDGASITIKGSAIKIEGGTVEINSGSLTHNGTNVGDTHVHGSVKPGLPFQKSGKPE